MPIQVTRLCGREQAIAQIPERLTEWRLVKLTGCGAVGKTRLPVGVPEVILERFLPDDWFIARAALASSLLVPWQVEKRAVKRSG